MNATNKGGRPPKQQTGFRAWVSDSQAQRIKAILDAGDKISEFDKFMATMKNKTPAMVAVIESEYDITRNRKLINDIDTILGLSCSITTSEILSEQSDSLPMIPVSLVESTQGVDDESLDTGSDKQHTMAKEDNEALGNDGLDTLTSTDGFLGDVPETPVTGFRQAKWREPAPTQPQAAIVAYDGTGSINNALSGLYGFGHNNTRRQGALIKEAIDALGIERIGNAAIDRADKVRIYQWHVTKQTTP